MTKSVVKPDKKCQITPCQTAGKSDSVGRCPDRKAGKTKKGGADQAKPGSSSARLVIGPARCAESSDKHIAFAGVFVHNIY